MLRWNGGASERKILLFRYPTGLGFDAGFALSRLYIFVAKSITGTQTDAATIPAATAFGHQSIKFRDTVPAGLVKEVAGTEAYIEAVFEKFALEPNVQAPR